MNDRDDILAMEIDTMKARLDEVALKYLLDNVPVVSDDKSFKEAADDN